MSIRSNFTAPNISLFFISLMLILPFLFPYHPNPIPTFYMEWLVALFALLAFLPLLKQTAWPDYQAPTIIILPLAMLVVMAVQYAVLDIAYWQHYFLVAQYFVLAALVMVLGAMLKQAVGFTKAIHVIAIALLISGLLSTAVIALDLSNIRLAGWVINSKLGGAVANVGQQNHLASLLALAITSLAYLFVIQRLKAWLTWPLFVVLLSGLALSASRSAWVYLTLIAITALLYRNLQIKSSQLKPASIANASLSNQRLALLVLLPVLFQIIQLGLPHLPTSKPMFTSNQRLFELAQTNGSPRLEIYKASWYVFIDNPLLGSGFGQMAWNDLIQASRVPQVKGPNGQAHNTVLQLLAETGVVGTAMLLVCMLAFIWRIKSTPISPERWLWWLSLLIIGTHAMLEYPLWYMHFLAPTALLLGLGEIRNNNITRYRPQLSFTLFTVLWSACLVQNVHDYRLIHGWFYQNQKVKLNAERFDLMYNQLKPIRAFSPFAVYADSILINSLPVDRVGLNDKLAITHRLLKAYVSPAMAYNYVTLLALDGQLAEAKTQLNNAYTRFPGSIDEYWQRTVKLTLNGEQSLFHLVKHIELLRDGPSPDYEAPNVEGYEFKKAFDSN